AHAGLAFTPGDPVALLTSLRALADLGAAGREAMGARARAHVLLHHDRDLQARQLAHFLEQLC
ncbi:MAG: hypothetical protein H0T76_12435, partial [Nannocystis sp.]